MKQELNPGDIIFIQDEKYKYPHHVGIFINKEQYMHAVNSNDTGKDGCVKKGRIEKKGRIITNAFRFTLEQGPITRSKSKAENKITSENLIKKVLETAEYLEIFKTLYSSKRADEAKKLIKEIMKNQANSSETQDRINPQKIEDINPRTKENKIIEDIGKFFVYKDDNSDDKAKDDKLDDKLDDKSKDDKLDDKAKDDKLDDKAKDDKLDDKSLDKKSPAYTVMAKALNLMNMINEKKEKEAKNNVISKKKNKQAKSSKNNKKKNQTKKIKQNEDSPYETSKKITKKGWHCVQFVVMTFNISFYLLVQNFTYKDIKDKHYSRKANGTNKKVHPNTIYKHVNKNAPIPLDAKFISVNKLLEICQKSKQFEELPKEILPNFAN